MYEQYYGLAERPFSITPDPRFIYLSQRHQDALAHLLYGIGRGGSGGFVQLTGEVGTGKTTLCRLLLEQVPDQTRIALILNPMLTPRELLWAICRELEIGLEESDGGLQDLGERLNHFLLEAHGAGERVVLIIDEAQNMSREALEQVRLLTNLETATDKLLQIILLGQPELREVLRRPSLRQLSQRITARYHLDPLERDETLAYVRHRMAVAGAARNPFTRSALRTLHRVSGGVPRLINIIADRALMAGYAREAERITPHLVRAAAAEVVGADEDTGSRAVRGVLAAIAAVIVLGGGLGMLWALNTVAPPEPETVARPAWQEVLETADARSAWEEAAALWSGISADEVAAACTGGEQRTLACQTQRGNWAYIRNLGMPVVLRLTEPPDGRVLLVGLAGDSIVVRQAGQDYRMPARQAERRWLGDFYVVWPDSGRVWQRGERGPEVQRLKELAARDPDLPWNGPIDDNYSEAFAEWVARFQGFHGLSADGMLGPATRVFLKAPQASGVSLMIEDGE